jgi:alkylation response protein AidB-like acyl-CoA dehydrogenase
LVETARRVLAAHGPDAWGALAGLGFQWISVPAEVGGSGGTLDDLVGVIIETGKHAPAPPIVDTALLGGWLLTQAGWPLPPGPVAVIPPRSASGLTASYQGGGVVIDGVAPAVPWASVSDQVLLVLAPPDASTEPAGSVLVRLEPRALSIRSHRNLAGELRDQIDFDGVRVPEVDVVTLPGTIDAQALLCRGALGRAALLVGAMLHIRDITVAYAGARTQFGQPIGRFQAVAHSLALIGEHTEQARIAVEAAALLFPQSPFEAAAYAKIVAGDAATVVAARAHQIHGAIGMTQEYELHRHTRALYAWSSEYGTEDEWSGRLGRDLLGTGAADLWLRLSAPTSTAAAVPASH